MFHWFYVNLVSYFGQGQHGFGKRFQIVCANNKFHSLNFKKKKKKKRIKKCFVSFNLNVAVSSDCACVVQHIALCSLVHISLYKANFAVRKKNKKNKKGIYHFV